MAQGTMAWILENATKRVRYFRHRNGTIASRMEQDSGVFEASPNYTEVQVVPVDAIVIRRDELPEVTQCDGSTGPTGAIRTVHGWSKPLGPSWHRDLARHQLALAEYQEEHPPVDEGQVRALNALMVEAANKDLVSIEGGIEFERFLVERGVRVEAKS